MLAQEALVQLELDSVALMPMGQAPHREIAQDAGAEVRFELCEAAVARDERLSASRLEIDREGPSYTVETLERLHEEAPDDELFWILGGDQAAALRSWREPERVLELCTIVAAERGTWRRSGIYMEASHLHNTGRIVFVDMPPIGVSSSLVRRQVRLGRPIRYLVPDAVAELVASRGLYGEAHATAGATA